MYIMCSIFILYFILYCNTSYNKNIYVNLNTHTLYNKFDRLYTLIQNLKSDIDNIINYWK